MTELLGIKAYARRRGVSKTAVQKAIKSGRITVAERDANGYPRIDPARADEEWERNTDQAQQRETASSQRTPSPSAKQSGLFEEPRDKEAAQAGDRTAAHFLRARTNRESFAALTAKLRYEREAGQLVAAEEVRQEFFTIARQFRDSLMNLAARVAPELAGISKPNEIRERLEREIQAALEAMARSAEAEE